MNLLVSHWKRGLFEEAVRILPFLLRSLPHMNSQEAIDGIFNFLADIDTTYVQGESLSGIRREQVLASLCDNLLTLGQPFLRVWFLAAMKLVRLYLADVERFSDEISFRVSQLRASCKQSDGITDDVTSKGSLLLDLYSVELEYISSTPMQSLSLKREIKSILEKCILASSAIGSPKATGLICEYGGRMLLHEQQYAESYVEFYEGFRTMADYGQREAAGRLLHFAILSNMLSRSSINPFDAMEVTAFVRDDELFAPLKLMHKACEEQDAGKVSLLLESVPYKNDTAFSKFANYLIDSLWDERIVKVCACYNRISLEELIARCNNAWTSKDATRKVFRLIQDGALKALFNEKMDLTMQYSNQKHEIQLAHIRNLQTMADALKQSYSSLENYGIEQI